MQRVKKMYAHDFGYEKETQLTRVQVVEIGFKNGKSNTMRVERAYQVFEIWSRHGITSGENLSHI